LFSFVGPFVGSHVGFGSVAIEVVALKCVECTSIPSDPKIISYLNVKAKSNDIEKKTR